MLAQPGQVFVQIVFVEAAPDAQHVAGGMHLGQAHGRQARALVQEPRDDLPERQLAGKVGTEGFREAEAAGNFGGGPDGADGSAFLQLDAVERAEDGEIAPVFEGEFDGRDLGRIAVGEVGDVAFLDFAVLAEGLAEVDGLVNLAVGGGPEGAGDVHAYRIRHFNRQINSNPPILSATMHVYAFEVKSDLTQSLKTTYLKWLG